MHVGSPSEHAVHIQRRAKSMHRGWSQQRCRGVGRRRGNWNCRRFATGTLRKRNILGHRRRPWHAPQLIRGREPAVCCAVTAVQHAVHGAGGRSGWRVGGVNPAGAERWLKPAMPPNGAAVGWNLRGNRVHSSPRRWGDRCRTSSRCHGRGCCCWSRCKHGGGGALRCRQGRWGVVGGAKGDVPDP
jgi:hypothetical protein